ncbi:MAG: bifunctional folylpolyglutamate synthase/dihydrofolate synthase [Phycisphaerales bacterium JB063]
MPTTRTKRKSKAKAPAAKGRLVAKPQPVRGQKISPASSITNYTTGLKWLYEHVDYERLRLVKYNDDTFSLDRMRQLLELLGNPHEQIKCVQIAGTKGKGSTCAMTASMLESCGYTVGLYTSPHLIDLRERIAINGDMIGYADCADIFKQIAQVEKKLDAGPPTFFEIMTAAAFKYFAEQAVDIAVLETGLGGRLDCTTVVTPLVTAITAISLDHTHLLGDTLGAIAREKAGIFKPGVPALTIKQEDEVEAALEECADEMATPLEYTGKQVEFSYRFEANKELGPHTRVCINTDTSKFEHLPVPLKGEHQAQNCGLALAILDKLKRHGFHFEEQKLIAGLAATHIPARMEQVHDQPRVIIDGAHNAASIQALIKSLGAHIQYDSLVMIFGCGQDKDVDGMLKQVALGADKVIFTRARLNPRAMEVPDLLHQFGEVSGKMAQAADNLTDALKLASRAVSREDLIIVTGSFYLAGEARKYFLDHAAKKSKR